VYRLDALSDAERSALLTEFSAATSEVSRVTITERFEAQAASTPAGTALTCGGEDLSYAEVNAQAGRLAHYLIGLGVQPGAPVGIALDRSVEMVVAIVAVLKAGGAYLPLDPEYPRARIEHMLGDSGAEIVLSSEALIGRLPQGGRIVPLDAVEVRSAVGRCSSQNPGVRVEPGSLAYVIYTSGSTGAPKGVMVTHGNVVRLFDATREWFRFSAEDVWTLFHSYAFDFSVWEIWGALLHGSRLVIAPKMITRSPAEFLNLLVDQRVTVLNQTPLAFYQLMRAEEENPAPTVSLP